LHSYHDLAKAQQRAMRQILMGRPHGVPRRKEARSWVFA
jgi:hypothetical protein